MTQVVDSGLHDMTYHQFRRLSLNHALVLRLEDTSRLLLREVQYQKIVWVISCSYQISEQAPDPELMNFLHLS